MNQKKTSKVRLQPRWDEIFASLGDGLIILDVDRRLIGINPAAERLTGFSAERVLGHLPEEAFLQNKKVLDMLSPAFREGQAVTLREISWAGRGQKAATVDLSATSMLDEMGELTGWTLAFRDMTPVKNLEEEVRKADRLAMMGTLAAGLAHEIKNPLGGIRGAAQLLERENLSPQSSDCLQIIVREVDRVNRLLTRLLTFAKPKTLPLEPLNLNEILDAILLLQKKILEERSIRLVREFDPSLPKVLGQRDELHQVFLNFIQNAVEAIPNGGGKIGIKSRLVMNYKIRDPKGKKPSHVVMAEISDSGVGISPEDMEKIFTPFFTTKEKGCGLGLAMTQRIISEHGGGIRVQSEKGRGTTFQVFLRSFL